MITPRGSPRSSRSASRASRDADGVARPRVRLIVNPVASRVRERSVRTVLSEFAPHCDVEVRETEGHAHAIALTAEIIAAGFDGVVAMGGDGTAHEGLDGGDGGRPGGGGPAGGAGG